MEKPVVIVVGTRPEAIKLIPLYFALKKKDVPTLLCGTFQHSGLLQQVLDIFHVSPDFNLDIMRNNQDLFYLTNAVLEKTKEIFNRVNPSLVLVQGDTTTAFAAALAAFYLKIPVGHVEAGLRTGNIYAPYPEELNRRIITQIAQYHFAPTALNVANLLAEGVLRSQVFCTGNTVVDALRMIKEKIEHNEITIEEHITQQILRARTQHQKIVLLTAHRRESFDGGLLRIFTTIKKFAQLHPDVFIIYPYHPNPNVVSAIESSKISNMPNIYLCPPVAYKELVYLLISSDWVVTDSGGIQEEAVSLGKHAIILREYTERSEALWEGFGRLVGCDETLLFESLQEQYMRLHTTTENNTIFGDGKSAPRIATIVASKLAEAVKTPYISFLKDNLPAYAAQ